MKKKFGLYGTNRRKREKEKNDVYDEEFYEDEMYEDEEYVEEDEIDEGGEYIDYYESDAGNEEAMDKIEYEEEAADKVEYEEESADVIEYEEENAQEAEVSPVEHIEYESDGVEYEDEAVHESSYDVGYQGEDGIYYESESEVGFGDEYDEYADEDEAVDIAFSAKLISWIKTRVSELTALDAIIAVVGVVLVVAAAIILGVYTSDKRVSESVEAIAPVGNELAGIGIVGESGLTAMADAALSGALVSEISGEVETQGADEDQTSGGKVSVSFESVEKDLKIRFTDAESGELITGTVFEVTLTNTSTKNTLVKTDDDKDGIIYIDGLKAGTYEAVITSTDKYTFPTTAQQVTVKDKVEYVVINVQDEVVSEKEVNVAVEDTQQNIAEEEEVVLTDTVEWVESTQTAISGTETYLLVDKDTIPDPSATSKAAARMLFDTISVSLDKTSLSLYAGGTSTLTGTSFTDSTDGDVQYKYTTEWKSSDTSVATVSGGTVTAKAAGTATITYTVTRTIITTTTESSTETTAITVDEYSALSDNEKGNCTAVYDGTDENEITGYSYEKTTETTSTSETTDTGSATCSVTVNAVKIASAALTLTSTATSCEVGSTVTVSPSKLVYTKNDESTETITSSFPTVTWSSSDTSIATVSSSGVVTGVKAGSVTITGKITGITGASGSELSISASVDLTITAAASLTLTLDRTSEVYIGVGGTTTLVATVSNYSSDSGVTWESSNEKVATVSSKGVVTGVAAGSVTITATANEKDSDGNAVTAACTVTVNSSATTDTTTKLKDSNGNQIYIKDSDGNYVEAVYADYFTETEFYIKSSAQYTYTGWQTIDGKRYYFDSNGVAVTGTQIIQGVTYNFGSDGAIATTVNGSTFGIDVSRHNGTIDWEAVKASGVDFVIIRCGYRGSSTGALIQDQNFVTNIKGATAAGLKVGIYVFSQAINEVEAVKEASLAVSCAQGYNLTYPIFIDTESSGGRADNIDNATRTAVVNAFCQTVQSAGYKAGIYASKSWFEDKLNMSSVGNYYIWLAQYAATPTYSGKYNMWQYSSKGSISGISGNVDLDYSYLGY